MSLIQKLILGNETSRAQSELPARRIMGKCFARPRHGRWIKTREDQPMKSGSHSDRMELLKLADRVGRDIIICNFTISIQSRPTLKSMSRKPGPCERLTNGNASYT